MQIVAPEIEEILKRLDRIEKLLQTQTREPEHRINRAERVEEWMMGPEIRHALHCGPARIKQLVDEGKLEMSTNFGRHPRYKWVNENK